MAEWQPIETAPKDGASILVFCVKFAGEISGVVEKNGMTITSRNSSWDGRSDYPGNNWWDDGGDYYATWCWPTHWMPLPGPPNSE